jgi:hypothetical protein
MTTDSPAAPSERARPPSAPALGAEPLLFIPLAGALGVVAAVVLLATAPGTLTLIFAILVALAGMVSVIAVVNLELSDADGSGGQGGGAR